jgi:hypothetical protein
LNKRHPREYMVFRRELASWRSNPPDPYNQPKPSNPFVRREFPFAWLFCHALIWYFRLLSTSNDRPKKLQKPSKKTPTSTTLVCNSQTVYYIGIIISI